MVKIQLMNADASDARLLSYPNANGYTVRQQPAGGCLITVTHQPKSDCDEDDEDFVVTHVATISHVAGVIVTRED